MIDIKGKGAVGIAIAFFSLRGMVSIPLNPCEYNFIFDDNISLKKVKVISCSYKDPYGSYQASIRNMSSSATKQTLKKFNPRECDLVFFVTDSLEMYNIPSHEINSTTKLTLNTYPTFKVNFGDVV